MLAAGFEAVKRARSRLCCLARVILRHDGRSHISVFEFVFKYFLVEHFGFSGQKSLIFALGCFCSQK